MTELFSDEAQASAKVEEDLLPPDVIEQLNRTYTRYSIATTELGNVAFRKATKTEYDRFLVAMKGDKNEAARAPELLARTLVVYCQGVFGVDARKPFNDMLEELPAIVGNCASAALEASGIDVNAQTKKYGTSSAKT